MLMNAQTLTVFKQNHLGEPVFSWIGELLAESPTCRLVSARFSGADAVSVDKVTFRKGDLMLERYYSDRWYNIYEIHNREDDQLKAWYCNISRPAVFEKDSIRFDDLALDLLIYPDRSMLLLDEDEFEALELDEKTRQACWLAVDRLKALAGMIKPATFPKKQ
jgi:hypothetical protein